MTGYALHPEARFDLDEIWEFIRADNLDAADRMIAEILAAVAALGKWVSLNCVISPARIAREPAVATPKDGPKGDAFSMEHLEKAFAHG